MEEEIFYSPKEILTRILVALFTLSLILNVFMVIKLSKYKNILHVTETLLQTEQSRLQKYIAGEQTSKQEEKTIIHITGAVKKPGVYEFTEQVRLFEVIEKAGGALDTADLGVLNLAQNVCDETKIYVPKKGEIAKDITINNTNSSSPNNVNSKININTATADQLTNLVGIGDSKAKDIIAYRKTNGAFKKTEDIMLVKGIGESTYDKIKSVIIVK
ncbi:helix-hairpin-helix domain-containing protein [Clostridium sp. 'deep sea']|uniref:helix-hairpin-helix domain-containing protein n=1 Tax=Clostridium sp. 'deep sea' TaxID=2779445 RepID=UPI00189696DC|nr:helix-hairpin-helix domain-containing protein [Clostridium sp. 'deep sea']QOR34331.1 helix-hairpin-helix domain-containing protein [Clostridium sp. 'deep sea']